MPYTLPTNKFVFTLHHYTQTDWEYLPKFCERNEDVVFLKVCQEKGSSGDTPHLQGCVVFSRQFKKQRPSAISKLLMGPNKDICLPDPDNEGKFLKHHYHVDGMRGTLKEAADYCGNLNKEGNCPTYQYGEVPVTKQGDRTDHHDVMLIVKKAAQEGMKFSELEDLVPKYADKSSTWLRKQFLKHRIVRDNFFETHEMWSWQREWIDYLRDNDPDPRLIIFMVDKTGNVGKSEFVRNAEFLLPNKSVFTCSSKDTTSLSNIIPHDGADIILIDAPRKVQFNLPYDFIEEVKNGAVINTKYECCPKDFRTPHVLVFMNSYPMIGKSILSQDRYIIHSRVRVDARRTQETRLANW
ncbi:Para-Rep C9 [Seminavis robusta]|uniref:Para-Rep C9 n=1 Tax=Seminavis robusta TaxID=568900 RepID=A0A9N8EXH7_9STRA|nr:Para-Rep C9 [Seminavis robusta]|eukprot:Sro1992_g309870.1 Para-Rep C9 (353) ;mRNA; r:17736-18794